MAESHGTTAHTEAPAEKREFPPFQKDTFASQLVSLLVAFVALYLIVSRIALPRVGGVIDARANTIEGDLADAQKLKDQSDAALKAYESELAAALEGELSFVGIERARLLTQLLLAASDGVGHKATSPAELGPAVRLLCERLIRPDLRGS